MTSKAIASNLLLAMVMFLSACGNPSRVSIPAIHSTTHGFDQTGKVSVLDTYGKVPLSFEANEGQVPREVQFLARGNGYSLFFAATELQLELRRPAATALPYKMHSVPTALHRNGSRHFEHAILHMQLIDLAEVTHSINQSATELIPEDRARQLFNALWPELEKQLIAIPAEPPTEKTYATGT